MAKDQARQKRGQKPGEYKRWALFEAVAFFKFIFIF